MRLSALRIILGDQLSLSISSLTDINKETDKVLMMEVADEATYVNHHPQKLILIFSAMRHFALALQKQHIPVDYIKLDDERSKNNTKALLFGDYQDAMQNVNL